MRLAVALLVLGVPAADVVADVLLVRAFGFLPVALYLLAAFVVAVLVMRWAGPITVVRATRRLQRGEIPGTELVDGLLMLVGGLYFAFPGPVSDAVGIVLVTPFLRRGPRAVVLRALRGRRAAAEETGPLDVREYRVE